MELIEDGFLEVHKDGTIINKQTNKKIGSEQGEYIRVGFKDFISNKIYIILAHRLVWITFNGLIEGKNLQINHKDGNKTNNNLSNLELTDNSGNVSHAYRKGLNKTSENQKNLYSKRISGDKNHFSVFNNNEVIKLRNDFSKNLITISEICEKYDISRRSVRNMLTGKTYSVVKENIIDSFKVNKKK